MNSRKIVFSPRAKQRMEEIAEYLYQKELSKEFVMEEIAEYLYQKELSKEFVVDYMNHG